MAKTVLVTGAAGFIGSHTAAALLSRGDRVIGLDNLNPYYDPARKRDNILFLETACKKNGLFCFIEGDIRKRDLVEELFKDYPFTAIVHLAAMGGIRVSITAPHLYCDVNISGTLTLLDAAVARTSAGVPASTTPIFVFASTGAVYNGTDQRPFVETEPCDRPRSPYAGSKRAAELLGYTYHHLYGLNFTALRFFTVYGPRNRPDTMAGKVMDSIFSGKEVPLYNNGQMHRDWTYIADIVQGIVAAVNRPLGYEIINLGRGEPVLLADFVRQIARCAGRKAKLLPAPVPGTDTLSTCANIERTRTLLGYAPQTSVADGVSWLWQWYEQTTLPSHG